jgi:hypothetical protein
VLKQLNTAIRLSRDFAAYTPETGMLVVANAHILTSTKPLRAFSSSLSPAQIEI